MTASLSSVPVGRWDLRTTVTSTRTAVVAAAPRSPLLLLVSRGVGCLGITCVMPRRRRANMLASPCRECSPCVHRCRRRASLAVTVPSPGISLRSKQQDAPRTTYLTPPPPAPSLPLPSLASCCVRVGYVRHAVACRPLLLLPHRRSCCCMYIHGSIHSGLSASRHPWMHRPLGIIDATWRDKMARPSPSHQVSRHRHRRPLLSALCPLLSSSSRRHVSLSALCSRRPLPTSPHPHTHLPTAVAGLLCHCRRRASQLSLPLRWRWWWGRLLRILC